jgi:hypothetical protein
MQCGRRGNGCKDIEHSIASTVRHLADIQYFMMQKSGNWGELGQDAVLSSFARQRYRLPNDYEISMFDIERLEKDLALNYELANLTLQELKEKENGICFVLSGRQIGVHDGTAVNELLRQRGSRYRLAGGMLSGYRSLIFAEAWDVPHKDYGLAVFGKEIERTPCNVLPMVAFTGHKEIVIRRESCEFIFDKKWKGFEPGGAIGIDARLRDLVLKSGYKTSSPAKFASKKELFVGEIVEFALNHELGHADYFYARLDPEEAGRQKSFGYFGENIMGALHEAAADWTPESDGCAAGPIASIITHYKAGSTQKARRMLLTYLSDNCFLDDLGQLKLISEIDLAIMASFLTASANFDFDAMDRKINGLHRLILDECCSISNLVMEKVKTGRYPVNNTVYGFDFIEAQINNFIQGARQTDTDRNQTLYQTAFWHNAFLLMKQFSMGLYIEITDFLEKEAVLFKEKLLSMIDLPASEKFRGDLRGYIHNQFSQFLT